MRTECSGSSFVACITSKRRARRLECVVRGKRRGPRKQGTPDPHRENEQGEDQFVSYAWSQERWIPVVRDRPILQAGTQKMSKASFLGSAAAATPTGPEWPRSCAWRAVHRPPQITSSSGSDCNSSGFFGLRSTRLADTISLVGDRPGQHGWWPIAPHRPDMCIPQQDSTCRHNDLIDVASELKQGTKDPNR